jgi:spore coat protein U-like protein
VHPNEENAMKKLILLATVIATAATSVFGQCNFSPAPGNAAFGNYSSAPSGPPQTATPTFNVQCQNNDPFTVSLSRGINSASFNPRTMKNAGGTPLNYNLYTDAANTQIWGDGTGGTVSQSYSIPSSSNNNQLNAAVPIYASLPLGADVGAGSYTDTITATLSWAGGSTTVTFNVTATAVGDCTVSAFTLNFGAYEPVVTNNTVPLDSSSIINVYCTKGTQGDVALDNGSNFAAGNRRMKSAAGAFMTYEIYKDAARATVWNAAGINSAISTSRTIPLGGGFIAYGRIPAGQDLAAGAYTDTLQAIVTY